jgi:hypothetical protein
MENSFEPQNFIPVIESDDFIGSVSVAETTDDQAEMNMDVLLGKDFDINAIVARVPEPSRVRVDYAKLAREDSDTFDASENVIDWLDEPEAPTFTPAPQRVEKDGLDRDLLKAARRGPTLTAWIKSELSRGAKIEDLISHARAVDPKIARDIEGCYLVMNEPSDEE